MAETNENASTMDDTLVFLMSMGFEFKDCQDAIKFGKTNVESAVEWLVAGKPGFQPQSAQGQSVPSLKLRPTTSSFDTGSAPYIKPDPIPSGSNSDASSTASPNQSEAVLSKTDQSETLPPKIGQAEATPSKSDQSMAELSDTAVVSRLHLNDAQRKYKEGFEMKKRDEAKKQVMLEKKRQKEDHARVLKEIAADRETKKLLQGSVASSTVAAPEPSDTRKPKEQKIEPKSSQQGCLLQIRLPDGSSLRQSFSTTDTLQAVWSHAESKFGTMQGYTFIQPFPRHEFSQSEMSQSLLDLHLTPTGSLVVQKVNQSKPTGSESKEMEVEETSATPPVTSPASMSAVPLTTSPITSPARLSDAAPAVTSPAGVAASSPVIPPVRVQDADPQYMWGHGQSLQTGLEQNPAEEPMHDDEEEAMEDEEEEEGPPQMVHPGMGFGHAGRGGPGFGRGGAGMQLGGPGMQIGGAGMQMGGAMNMPQLGNVMGGGHDMFGMQGGPGAQHAFAGLGQRLVPVAHPEEVNTPPHRSARELAFERAQARMAQPAPPPAQPSTSQSPGHQAPTSAVVLSLVQHCLKHIGHRLNDPRHQLLSLSGISEEMAQLILNHLLKEKQLKPKTLHAFTPCYLRKLILDCYPYATNELIHSVRLHTNLSQLSISACPLITDAGFQCLTTLKKLKKLNLSCCKQLTNKTLKVLSSLQQLVSVNLEATGITDTGVVDFLSSQHEHLQHLNLSRTAVSHAILRPLPSSAPHLRSLALEDTKVVSLSGIEELTMLETLNVARTNIVTESLTCVVRRPTLRSLNISNTENLNGDDALKHLQGLKLTCLTLPLRHTTTNGGLVFLTEFPLVSVDLTNYIFVGDEGMEHIGKILTLKKLLLSNTKLTDEGMFFLSGLVSLEVLNLDRTLVTDAGAAVIAGFPALTDLSFSCTGITTRFLLTGALNRCTNLSKINMSKTLVTDKGIRNLCLPFLQMLNLDGTKVTPSLTVSTVTGCPTLTQMSARNLEMFTRDDEVEEAEMEVQMIS